MDEIAQITAYKNSYGSPLQTLATQVAFSKCGLGLRLFRYEPKGLENKKRQYFKALRHPTVITTKINEKIEKNRFPDYISIIDKRDRNFETFLKKNIIATDVITDKITRDAKIREFGFVLSGSDQIWNPINYGDRFFTCEFVPDSIKKYSYASSFGTEYIPRWQLRGTSKYLGRFDEISFREKTGAETAKRLTGKNYPVVLDPTLLLAEDDWDKYIVETNPVKEKYILVYYLSNQNSFFDKVLQIKKLYGYKIVTIPHTLEYSIRDAAISDCSYEACNIELWLRLIKDAEIVLTDSYHGMIFSILFKKQFGVFRRFRDGSEVSANARIYEVIDKLGLKERLFSDDLAFLESIIDYKEIDDKLKPLRDYSYDYIAGLKV